MKSKEDADARLAKGITALCDLQEKLYAQNQWSILLIFQAMDAAGKDASIKHVLSGVNPQGCQVTSFKAPSGIDLAHDFLWRAAAALPDRGRIGIFNRSYYEEVLVVRVHPEILAKQNLPKSLASKKIWKERFQSINNFERHLARNGTVVLKFFLNVSKEEQRQRLLERLDEKAKNFKFDPGDLKERACWDEYMHAYEQMIRHTSTPEAPWHVIPADHKWFTRLAVSSIVIEKLRALRLHFPALNAEEKRGLGEARRALRPPGE